jgi:hypothetical protein
VIAQRYFPVVIVSLFPLISRTERKRLVTIGKIVPRRSLSGHVCQGDVRVPSLCDRA